MRRDLEYAFGDHHRAKMKIRFRCSCGQQLAVPSEHGGKKARCPGCGAQVSIPASLKQGPAIRIDRADLEAAEGAVASGNSGVAPSEPSENMGSKTMHVPPGRTMIANRRIAGKVCAICQDKIKLGEEIRICDYCELPFHLSCWEENGGCGAYGCEASPDAPGRQREPDFSVAEDEVSESRPAHRQPAIQGAGPASGVAGSPTVASRTSGRAIASLVLGVLLAIASLVLRVPWLCGVGSVLAVILGHCALSEMDESQGEITGRRLAIAGLVLGYVFGAIALLYFIVILGQ